MLGAMVARPFFGLLALAGFALPPCGTAHAHGTPPTAYAVVAHDAQGALAVRLSTGVALRRSAERFQFVCPAAWGDEYAAPLAALDDGTIVVGASNGLMLLKADGTVQPHPDPAAVGISTELVRGTHGAFSLRITPEGSQVLAIDANKVRVVWQDTKSWYSLAALDEKLVLLRSSGNAIEQVVVSSTDGKELEHQVAMVGTPVDYAFARATGGAAYALLLFQTAPELGSLRMNTFAKIGEGTSSIAGPLALADSTLVAVDGQLSKLVNGLPAPLSETAYVLCLEQADGLPYACKPDGIARVSEQGLGEPLFKLAWLAPPNLQQVAPGKPHDRCDYQWQDMRFDLIALGTPLPEDALADASVVPVGAEPAPSDAGPADAAEVASDSGTGSPHDAGPDGGPGKRKHEGCSVGATGTGGGLGWLLLLGVALSLALRPRGRA
jgi:MYXO-CTERM domain-containing protein